MHAAVCRAADDPPLPRVLIIDDSAVTRAIIGRSVVDSGRFKVVAALASLRAAHALLRDAPVDLIVLDIDLPGLDRATALPALIAIAGSARVIAMSSVGSGDESGAAEALALGAADTLAKPAEPGSDSQRFRAALLGKLDRLAGDPAESVRVPGPASRRGAAAQDDFAILAIGASTGGIHALGRLLRALPSNFQLPILITQHLPADFMPYFAAQIAVLAGRPAEVATDRLRIRSGRVIVAPGDAHLRCVALSDGGAAIRLNGDAVPGGCMPSVDPMFASVAQVYGHRALAVVLSGMGRDGAEGARAVAAAGGCVLVQDEASSVIWGMPGAAAPHAAAILPPETLALVAAGRRRP